MSCVPIMHEEQSGKRFESILTLPSSLRPQRFAELGLIPERRERRVGVHPQPGRAGSDMSASTSISRSSR